MKKNPAVSAAKNKTTVKARNEKENKARKVARKSETPQQSEDRATRANLAEVRKNEGKKPKGPAIRKASCKRVKSGTRK